MAHARVTARPGARLERMETDDLGLLACYQDRICELEHALTTAQDQLQVLRSCHHDVSASRLHLLDLFNHAPMAYVVHDRAGTIHEFNRKAAALLGLSIELEGRVTLGQFVPKTQLHLWLEHMRRYSAGSCAGTELLLGARDGRTIPVQLITVSVPRPLSRHATEFRTVVLDMSVHLEREATLSGTQQDYHQLVDTIEGVVWEADAKTLDITFVSSYAERLLGYPLQEWSRPGFWKNRIYPDDRDRVISLVARAVSNRGTLRLDYRVVAADRRIVWLHDSLAVVERAGRLKILGVAIDNTKREQAEAEARQARDLLEQRVAERTAQLRETVADLEAFSYSLSHDMRSPLRAMQGFAALLESRLGERLGPEGLDFLRRIIKSAERLDLLVQDVLKYGCIARASLELKSIRLETLLDHVLSEYPALVNVKAQIRVQLPLLPVLGHEAFVAQALSNLLTNAVKFMPKGRSPRVRVWTEKTGGNGEPGRVRIWVEDNGVGIAREDQTRIFNIFERVQPRDQYEGTGIGLAIVQKAVERMGGHVGVLSAPGQGSKFWVELREP